MVAFATAIATRNAISSMTPKFSKGDRVKLSASGLAARLGHSYSPERRGMIDHVSPTGTGFHVLWDGRRTTDDLHGDYLERAEATSVS
jgi:hypothetical protein